MQIRFLPISAHEKNDRDGESHLISSVGRLPSRFAWILYFVERLADVSAFQRRKVDVVHVRVVNPAVRAAQNVEVIVVANHTLAESANGPTD